MNTTLDKEVQRLNWCVLQIGYFQAKQTFFGFSWEDVGDDLGFVLSRYFPGETFE
jgi:hypothetical protein